MIGHPMLELFEPDCVTSGHYLFKHYRRRSVKMGMIVQTPFRSVAQVE